MQLSKTERVIIQRLVAIQNAVKAAEGAIAEVNEHVVAIHGALMLEEVVKQEEENEPE